MTVWSFVVIRYTTSFFYKKLDNVQATCSLNCDVRTTNAAVTSAARNVSLFAFQAFLPCIWNDCRQVTVCQLSRTCIASVACFFEQSSWHCDLIPSLICGAPPPMTSNCNVKWEFAYCARLKLLHWVCAFRGRKTRKLVDEQRRDLLAADICWHAVLLECLFSVITTFHFPFCQ